jgi:glycosyltransferase involved in cell wall biosynthesis
LRRGKFRILFFNRWVGLHIGGTETHIKELAWRLAKRGHEVHILTTRGNKLKKYEKSVKIWYVAQNLGEPPFSRSISADGKLLIYAFMFAVQSLLKLLILRLKDVKFEVISVHCTLEAFLMRLIGRVFGTPYVFIFEGYTNMEAKVAKHANLQIAISQDIVNKCFTNYGYKPMLIPIGIDKNWININGSKIRAEHAKNGEKLVLTACRLDARKDIPTLISAAYIVRQKDQKVKFLVVGDGIEREKIEKQIDTLKLSNTVKIIREMPISPGYFKACDIFALPSLYEGFGIVFLEAMSAGLPIISTTAPAIPEVVNDAGILIPPRKPELLAEKILQVANNDELRKELIERGLRRVKKYDWDKLITKYEKAYKSVIYSHDSKLKHRGY